MLYTMIHSPWECDFDSLLLLLDYKDDLLLLQDAVIAALQGSKTLLKLNSTPANVSVLEEDVIARGLTKQISSKIFRLHYIDFVNLTIKHEQQISW
ncbi:sulfurtransferase complex subunit TusB [Candidatus Pantoea carbekii]|uniref:Protein TusB n=1 Tax=Candidatus Pantoea carbekii TaxID=1235990 RepID=U3U7G9_9GAMM|nr:sulfurtransferase complex subunit TusB [Candidatus Pantoea carbekii]AKC32466.1 DsrH-like sulfur reduction protein [Candidatus Pantoea carbekii]BAO00194.1 hypothetical protein HHS_02240 [Candidatus Pantoea carbekii]